MRRGQREKPLASHGLEGQGHESSPETLQPPARKLIPNSPFVSPVLVGMPISLLIRAPWRPDAWEGPHRRPATPSEGRRLVPFLHHATSCHKRDPLLTRASKPICPAPSVLRVAYCCKTSQDCLRVNPLPGQEAPYS